MKVAMFHLMPFPAVPDVPPHGPNWKEAGVWIDVPNQVYNPVIGNELYNEYLDELEYTEQMGFDGMCVNEHHSNVYGTMPSPNIMAASLARRTKKGAIILLGNSVGLYSPAIRIAEEISMMDVISGGRMVAGFPVGTSQDTNWVYGQIPATFRQKYYEACDLIEKALESHEPFAWNGKYNQLRYVNIWPRPVQQPRPPIWVPGGGSVETWDFTIRKNWVYAALSYGGYMRAKQTMDGFWNRVQEMGAEPNPYRTAFLQLCCVSDSLEQAKKEYQEGVEFFYQRLLGATGRYFPEAPGYRTELSVRKGFARSAAAPQPTRADALSGQTPEQQLQRPAQPAPAAAAPAGDGPGWDQLLAEGNIIAGNPDEVAAQLRTAMQGLRVGHLLPLLQIGSMRRKTVMKNIEMFGKEVLPQVKDMWDDEGWEDHWWPKPIADAQRATPAPLPR